MSVNARSRDSLGSRANSKIATKAKLTGAKASIEATIEASRNRERLANSTDKIAAANSLT